jgi:hypothetical protein
MFSLLLLVLKNKELFRPNSDIRNINIRCNSNLHLSRANLTVFQKGVIILKSVFNKLPSTIKSLSYDVEQFKLALKSFLLGNSFDGLKEYFDQR